MRKLFSILFFLSTHIFSFAQATIVKQINPGGSDIDGSISVLSPGLLAFNGSDGISGREVWVSDGTADGTRILTDAVPGSGSSDPWPYLYYKVDQKVFFFGSNETGKRTLFVHDLVTLETQQVKVFEPINGYLNIEPRSIQVVNGHLTFLLRTGVVGQGTHKVDLWTSDGTISGTFRLLEVCSCVFSYISTVFENKMVFYGNGAVYQTDGTVSGTTSIQNSLDSQRKGSSLISVDNTLYLTSWHLTDSIYYIQEVDAMNGIGAVLDSIQLSTQIPYVSRTSHTFMTALNTLFFMNDGTVFSFNQQSLKFQKLNTFSNAHGKDIFNCNGKIIFYAKSLHTSNYPALISFDPQTNLFSEIARREKNFSWIQIENPLCYNNYLVGEWSRNQGSGCIIISPTNDSTYFASWNTSYSFVETNGYLYWVGGDPSDNFGTLWKLNLSTVPVHEPQQNQIDLLVYPNLTSEGIFQLSSKYGNDLPDLMSVQLVNAEGRIVHIHTLPDPNQPIYFGPKAAGIYYLLILTKDGRRAIQKVVYH